MSPQYQVWKASLYDVDQEVPKGPQIAHTIAIILGHMPQLEAKTILWKTLYASDTKYRESELKTSWRLPSCWLAFVALEGVLQATRKEMNGISGLTRLSAYKLQHTHTQVCLCELPLRLASIDHHCFNQRPPCVQMADFFF